MGSGLLDCKQAVELELEILIITMPVYKKSSRRLQAITLGNFRNQKVSIPQECTHPQLWTWPHTCFLLPSTGDAWPTETAVLATCLKKCPSQHKFSLYMSLLTCLLPAPHLPFLHPSLAWTALLSASLAYTTVIQEFPHRQRFLADKAQMIQKGQNVTFYLADCPALLNPWLLLHTRVMAYLQESTNLQMLTYSALCQVWVFEPEGHLGLETEKDVHFLKGEGTDEKNEFAV